MSERSFFERWRKQQIIITHWDSDGPEAVNSPEGTNEIASFEIKDPRLPTTTQNSFCVGFKFTGGRLHQPANWVYDHTNYYDFATNPTGIIMNPKKISRVDLEAILKPYDTTIEDLLSQYCKRLRKVKPHKP